MTIPSERTNSVLEARSFLLALLNPKLTPRVPSVIRKEARRILKHYPTELCFEMFLNGHDVFEKLYKSS